jgi:hypothetical protein
MEFGCHVPFNTPRQRGQFSAALCQTSPRDSRRIGNVLHESRARRHLNRSGRSGVSVGMRNFVIDTSRGLAAAGVFLAAVVHLDLWVQGFRSIATIGPLFMLDFVAGMIIGVGVLVWRHWLPALAAAGFGAATVIAFWISVIHGLFGVKETTGGSSEILAEIAEYTAVAFGLAVVLMLLWQPKSGTQFPSRSASTRRPVAFHDAHPRMAISRRPRKKHRKRAQPTSPR